MQQHASVSSLSWIVTSSALPAIVVCHLRYSLIAIGCSDEELQSNRRWCKYKREISFEVELSLGGLAASLCLRNAKKDGAYVIRHITYRPLLQLGIYGTTKTFLQSVSMGINPILLIDDLLFVEDENIFRVFTAGRLALFLN